MIIYYTDGFESGREESHRLLEKALAAYTGDEKKAKKLIGSLKKGEHGKPYIEGFCCFSISHTGSIWAVLIADRECGLDIQLGRKSDIKAISERWFAPEDAEKTAALIEKNPSEAIDTFFRIWTRREALTKAMGSTVYDPDLPAVSGGEALINGNRYVIRDIRLPGMPELYAAMCIHKTESVSEPGFKRLYQ